MSNVFTQIPKFPNYLLKYRLTAHESKNTRTIKKHPKVLILKMAGTTRLELATSCVTGDF